MPQCKFARRAIIRTANSANSHGVPAPRRHGTAAAPRRRGAALRQRFLARCMHWQLAGAHYFALCMHGLRTAGRVYGSQRAATTHVGKSPHCRALGVAVREISVAAGTVTGVDVMAGGAAAGAAPQPSATQHNPHKFSLSFFSVGKTTG